MLVDRSQKNAVVFFLFLIYPLITFPISLYWISRKKRKGFILLSLLLSLLTVVLPPYGDLYRYYLEFNQYISTPFHRFVEDVKIDFIFYLYEWMFAQGSLNFEWVRMSLAFVMYNLLFSVFFEMTKNINSGKKYLLLFMSYLAVCNWMTFTNGFRSVYANTLIFYGIYKLLVEKKKSGYVYMLISIFVHISMLFPFMLVLISNVIKVKIGFKHTVFMLLAFIPLFNVDLVSLIMMLEKIPFLTGRLIAYLDGYWAADFLADRSLKGLFVSFSYIILVLLPFFFLFIKVSQTATRLSALNSWLFIFMFPLLSFQTIVMRYTFFIAILSFIYLLIYNPKVLFGKSVLFLCICYLILNFYSVRHRLADSKVALFATSSLYGIINNQFDAKWCDKHVMDDGSLKIGYEMMKQSN